VNPAWRRSQGMVLIAVLWMVAALSIVVMGVVRSAREEARIVARMRQGVEAQALGDAAIHLVLQGMTARSVQPGRLEHVEVGFHGVDIAVQVVPLNGLIDINAAPAPLLAKLYMAAGVGGDAAQALAQATAEFRSRVDARGAPRRFEAIEELLQVPGVDYGLYARLADSVTADSRGSGKVNPMAAPVGVLAVLAGGDTALASRIAAGRDASSTQGTGMDTSSLDSAYLDNAVVRRYRIQARVPMADGGWQQVSRSVELMPRAREGMPWHTFNSSRSFKAADRPAF